MIKKKTTILFNMATPKKIKLLDSRPNDDEIDIEGYIHDVTPVKTSRNNNKYFNAVVQQKEKFTDMVCYRSDLHDKMTDLQKNR
jgi:hypothetical protein